MASFRAHVVATGKTTTGIRVPDDVVAALGSGKRPPVRVTVKGYTYRTTVAVMGGEFWIGVNAEHRAASGVEAGEELDVELELDTAPRELAVPADLQAALDADADARRTFDSLSYSNRSWHVYSVEGAKTDETRRRRIAKSIDALRAGRPR
jgi:hypothetical protein